MTGWSGRRAVRKGEEKMQGQCSRGITERGKKKKWIKRKGRRKQTRKTKWKER